MALEVLIMTKLTIKDDREMSSFLKAEGIVKDNPNPVARVISKNGEIYEGTTEFVKEKYGCFNKLTLRVLKPKRIIDGVSYETDIDYIDIPVLTEVG